MKLNSSDDIYNNNSMLITWDYLIKVLEPFISNLNTFKSLILIQN